MHPRSRQALPHLYYPPGMYQTRINPRLPAPGGGGSSLLTGLAHWWDLLGDATDSVGGANLTTSEAFTGTAPSGDTNCIVFDGTGGAEVGGAAVAGESRTSITIGLWWRRDGATDTRSIIYYGAENTISFVGGTRLTTRIGSVNNAGVTTLATDTWYCMVLTATGGAWEVYMNNSLYDSGTDSFDFTPAVEIFDLGNRAGTDLIGKMCCCAIWDRILTGAEITEFYNSGVNLKYADL